MADTQITQEELAESLRQDQKHFDLVTQTLSETDQITPFTQEGWSVKDFLAHMAHWKQAAHAFLVAFVHDQPLPTYIESGDKANAIQQQIYASLSLQEAQSFWQEAHTHMLHLVVDELGENLMTEEVHVPWDEEGTEQACGLVAEMCGHDVEHFELIEGHFKNIL
ncbi:MAG TPA: maleylpyruvate isomerase N-terminal domain-containing protein [Ktedonobacteraceae bacterium]|nr:maleylpyruvate isomerase N-terminal domain-containing protein [Ktedonobacteraceae bacterium]